MVKRILYPLLQFAAFLGLMFVGGNWDGINLNTEIQQMQHGITPHVLIPTIKTQVGATHILIANGLIYASLLLLIILILEVLTKKLKPWALFSAGSYLLAVLLAFAMKMGLPPAF